MPDDDAQREADWSALKAVSGALVDAGDVPVPEPARYGEAVRQIIAQRDTLRRQLDLATTRFAALQGDLDARRAELQELRDITGTADVEAALGYITAMQLAHGGLRRQLDEAKATHEGEMLATEHTIEDLGTQLAAERAALERLVKLQSHYAYLLNSYDGGKRIQFGDATAWRKRLAEIDPPTPPSAAKEEPRPFATATDDELICIVDDMAARGEGCTMPDYVDDPPDRLASGSEGGDSGVATPTLPVRLPSQAEPSPPNAGDAGGPLASASESLDTFLLTQNAGLSRELHEATQRLTTAEARLAAMEAVVEQAHARLRFHEWSDVMMDTDEPCCFDCGGPQKGGHRAGCLTDAALDALRAQAPRP